jgi:phage N-6-adenine-methyltransferase
MAMFGTKFESKRQDWETPDSIFLPLRKEFSFNLDVCASKENAKCLDYFDEEKDALSQHWVGTCWMNPPFGNQGKWVKKAYEESREGATVVCLLPARTNTNWWHEYCLKGEIRYIKGRPKFVGAKYGLPQPLAIVIFEYKEPFVRVCHCKDVLAVPAPKEKE